MKTASLTLALPATLPAPRKEDIINAMVERARVQHHAEAERLAGLRKEAEAKIEAAILKEFKARPHGFAVRVTCYSSMEIEYKAPITPAIRALVTAKNDIPSLRPFIVSDVKKAIRARLDTGGERVKALLANPDAVQKLDALLVTITA